MGALSKSIATARIHPFLFGVEPRDLPGPLAQFQTTRFSKEDLRKLMLWQVVMLVTCVEAYLQDLLAIAASIDPKLMDETQQVAPYAEVISATSLDGLASELRARWARRWLSDGGPTRWISRLKRMGARGYTDGLAPRLELIWGIVMSSFTRLASPPRTSSNDIQASPPQVLAYAWEIRTLVHSSNPSATLWSRQSDTLLGGIHRCLPKPSQRGSSEGDQASLSAVASGLRPMAGLMSVSWTAKNRLVVDKSLGPFARA